MAANGRERNFIALAVDSIVYAPLFIAKEAGLFDGLGIEFGIMKVGAEPLHTNEIFSEEVDPPLIIVCDPIHAILANQKKGIHIGFGGVLVTKPATWFFDSIMWLAPTWVPSPSPFKKIITYPMWWTADTLLRYFLRKSTADEAAINIALASIENKAPGEELRGYHANHTAPQTSREILAIMTMSYLEILSFEENLGGDHYKFDFARDLHGIEKIPQDLKQRLTSYPMTALLVPRSAHSRKSEVRVALAAINIALGYVQDPSATATCLALLRRHYDERESRNSGPSHRLLDPLPSRESTDLSQVAKAFEKLRGIYADRAGPSLNIEHLPAAWDIFLEAHKDGMPPGRYAPNGVDAAKFLPVWEDHDKGVGKGKGKSRGDLANELANELANVRLTNAVLDKALRNRLNDAAPKFRHKEWARDIVRWLNDKKEHGIDLNSFQVIQDGTWNYVCYEKEKRRALREKVMAIADLPSQFDRIAAGANGCCVLLCGDAGCGKSAFSKEVQKYLASRHGFAQPVDKIDVTSCADLAAFNQELTARFSLLADLTQDGKPATLLIDEANKPLPGEDGKTLVLGTLLGKMKPGAKHAGDTQGHNLDLHRLVWFFAGTFGSSIEMARRRLDEELQEYSGGEFGKRILWELTPELPPSNDPFQMVVKAVAMMKKPKPVLGQEVEPVKQVDPRLLLSLAVADFAYATDLDNRLDIALSRRRRPDFLTIDDAWNAEEIGPFFITYEKDLKDLKMKSIPIL